MQPNLEFYVQKVFLLREKDKPFPKCKLNLSVVLWSFQQFRDALVVSWKILYIDKRSTLTVLQFCMKSNLNLCSIFYFVKNSGLIKVSTDKRRLNVKG